MSADVCLAAMMPARRAACSGSPFFTRPLRTSFSASRDMRIDPRATASRLVAGFSPTSTILTRPWASTWERRDFVFTVGPREKERQALDRHGQCHALHLHVGGYLQRA